MIFLKLLFKYIILNKFKNQDPLDKNTTSFASVIRKFSIILFDIYSILYFLFWATLSSDQGLLLVLCSEMTPGRLMGFHIWCSKNQTWSDLMQGMYPTCYIISLCFDIYSVMCCIYLLLVKIC